MQLLPWQQKDWQRLRQITQDLEAMRHISNGRPWTDERISGLAGRQIVCANGAAGQIRQPQLASWIHLLSQSSSLSEKTRKRGYRRLR